MFDDEIILTETNEIAVIPFAENTLHIEPIFLDGVNQKFVRRFGAWASVRTLRNVRFEKRREREYLNNTMTGFLGIAQHCTMLG